MIYVFGTLCLDRIRHIERLPLPGQFVDVLKLTNQLGGEAANTAAALTKWKAETALIANALGPDPEGEEVTSRLKRLGIKVINFKVDPLASTPATDIYVTPDGERTMFGNGFLAMDDFVSLPDFNFKPSDWFSCEPNMELGTKEMIHRASAVGMGIYLMDVELEGLNLAPGFFWQSSTDIYGFKGKKEENLEWVNRLVAAHGCTAFLTDGDRGLYFGGPGREAVHIPVRHAEQAVDSTGAGDQFRAGMLFGLAQQWDIERCISFGSSAAALSVRQLGGAESAATLEEVLEYLADCSIKV